MPILGMFARFAFGWALRLALLYIILVGLARIYRSSVLVLRMGHQFAYVDPARVITVVPKTPLTADFNLPRWTPDGRYNLDSSPDVTDIYDSYSATLSSIPENLECSATVTNNNYICWTQFHASLNLLDMNTLKLTPVFPGYKMNIFRLAPDGQRSAFAVQSKDGTTLYLANSLNAAPRVLLSQNIPIYIGDWSANGRYLLIFTSAYNQNEDFLLDTGDGRMRSLNHEFGIQTANIRDIAWSPDGSKLVFQAVTKYERLNYTGPLYVLDIGSGHLTQVSGDDGNTPSWSPDSRHLVYQSAEQVPLSATGHTFIYHVYAVNADGTEWHEIGADAAAVWLSDNEHIALVGGSRVSVIDREADQPAVLVADFPHQVFYDTVWR